MPLTITDELLRLMVDDEPSVRMLAQHMLCEGYAGEDAFLPQLFLGWDRWGAERAFSEFPMLSYVPIAADRVEECCQRAASMVENRSLLDPATRCAGKLLEHVLRLPASELGPYVDRIEATTRHSKIFFRVDTQALRERLEWHKLEADALASRLENALAVLSADPNHPAAFKSGLHALEALRSRHPHYIDLAGVLARTPPADGAGLASFLLTLHSLIHCEQNGLESLLAKHTLDARESIHSHAVEALVRLGTPTAGHAFLEQFSVADAPCQRWIARGLQRIRTANLAEGIAQLRAEVNDPTLWLMLFVAEVRQFDAVSLPRIVDDLERVPEYANLLMEALSLYARVHAEQPGARELQNAFMTYLQRANQNIQRQLAQSEIESSDNATQIRDKPVRKW